MIVQIVGEILLDQTAALPSTLYLHHFLCLHFSDVPYFRNPLPGKLRRSSFWLVTDRSTFDFRHKKDFSVPSCLPAGSVANSSSSQATASCSFTGG